MTQTLKVTLGPHLFGFHQGFAALAPLSLIGLSLNTASVIDRNDTVEVLLEVLLGSHICRQSTLLTNAAHSAICRHSSPTSREIEMCADHMCT